MTEPDTSHLDLDALADALAEQADAASSDHLASCASCTSRLAELSAADARVLATLAALPAPAVPADLDERLTAAFAAEPPLAPARSSVTALPERVADRSPRRFLPAAAAAVLLLSGAGLGYAVVTGSGSGSESADSAAGAAADPTADLVLNASGTDYADTAAVSAVLGGVLEGRAGDAMLREGAGTGGSTSGGDSTDGGATTQEAPAVEDAETSAKTEAAPPAAAMAAGDPLERLRTPEGLTACLGALASPEEPDLRPLALDYALFQGAPALAVVLPDPDPQKLSVFVVGPECTAGNENLRTFFRIDAP